MALLLLVATRYGYHRDELYFLEASRHMAWGYVDQPPFSIALVRLSRALFGNSLVGLRLFPALADGACVVLTALIARELGGGRIAQGLGALAVAISPFLIAGHLAGPTIYDFTFWLADALLVVRILRTGRERLWLAVGGVTGMALMNKETIAFLFLGLALGFVLTGQGRWLRSPWLWAGVGVALLLWSPNLAWQARHGWPTIEMSRNLRREHSGLGYSLTFVPIQLLLPGWWAAPVWMAGLWALWRERRFRPYRAFAVAYAALFVLIGVFIGDRPYYFAALYGLLFGAGAIVTGEVVAGGRRFLSERPPARRRIWRSARAASAWLAVLGILNLPLSLPILPARALHTVPLQDINYNLGETVGWQELVAEVGRAYDSLAPAERASAVIVTANYGEAGAIDRYGPAIGLPGAFSGHNSYWWWGPPTPSIGVAILVGFDEPGELTPYFRRLSLAGRVSNSQGVANDEEGAPIWIGREQRSPWPAIWADFKVYG